MQYILDFDKMVFVGAVGALVPEIPLGSLCTPLWCISGNLANGYLLKDLREYIPYGKVLPNDNEFVKKVEKLYPLHSLCTIMIRSLLLLHLVKMH